MQIRAIRSSSFVAIILIAALSGKLIPLSASLCLLILHEGDDYIPLAFGIALFAVIVEGLLDRGNRRGAMYIVLKLGVLPFAIMRGIERHYMPRVI